MAEELADGELPGAGERRQPATNRSSSDKSPASAGRSTSTATSVLVTLPVENIVPGRTGSFVASTATPCVAVTTSPSGYLTATRMPGAGRTAAWSSSTAASRALSVEPGSLAPVDVAVDSDRGEDGTLADAVVSWLVPITADDSSSSEHAAATKRQTTIAGVRSGRNAPTIGPDAA